MRRRPPATVLAYIAAIAAMLVAGFIVDGAEPGLLAGTVVLGAGAVGLYLGSRIAWILVTALHTVNLLAVLIREPEWWNVPVLLALLALLLAPPTRRYIRRVPGPEKVGGTRRLVRIGAMVSAGLVVGLIGIGLLFRPDPVSGDLELVRSERPGQRVLLIGNALTSENAMPRMVGELAAGDPGARPIFAVRYALRGSSLEDALDDDRLTDLLAERERWDQVVLQEHSQVVSRAADRQAHTLPAATALDAMARRSGAKTVLFSTWGYEAGDPEADSDDSFGSMQARVTQGYRELASRLSAPSAPVGRAWETALREEPGLDLWAADGRRPTRTGSYLTACVLYAVLTQRDPSGSTFTGGLDAARARWLQRIAAASVEPRSLR